MKKKVFLIILLMFIFTGCGKKDNTNIIEKLQNKINGLNSYSIDGNLDIYAPEETFSYKINIGYLKDDYPTEEGITISQIRSENELFLARIIFSHVLEGLTPAELASVVCAITTEDMRADLYSQLPLSPNVRKRLNKIKDIRRELDKKQKDHGVEDPMYINGFYSPLIEMWTNGAEWDSIIDEVDMGEGDIVRTFKRVIDVLRQFCTISNIPEELVFTAREAIDLIQRTPIDIDN